MGMERSGRVLGALWARSVFPTVPIWYLALGMGEYMKPDGLGSLVGMAHSRAESLVGMAHSRASTVGMVHSSGYGSPPTRRPICSSAPST
jgi:hypothetical protein